MLGIDADAQIDAYRVYTVSEVEQFWKVAQINLCELNVGFIYAKCWGELLLCGDECFDLCQIELLAYLDHCVSKLLLAPLTAK